MYFKIFLNIIQSGIIVCVSCASSLPIGSEKPSVCVHIVLWLTSDDVEKII